MTSSKVQFPVFSSASSKLVLILGPMFSGKTSSLISELTRYVDVDIPVAYINSSEDTRAERFSTHNSSFSEISTKIQTFKTTKLLELDEEQIEKYGVLAVDESQFFDDLIPFTKRWLMRKKIIYVAGLDGDIHQKIFGDLVHLIPYASEVRKLNAVCDPCRKHSKIVNAPFTIRLSCPGRVNPDNDEKKLIGGKDIYVPVCSDCLFEKRKPQTSVQLWEQELNYII
jgi:thymidine kinase